ncbi:MAG: fasciclin domain-containing protein [Acidimicrobiia bacterium]
MRRFMKLTALIAALALVAAACGGDDETSVLDVAVENGQFSILIAAIEAADLEDTLEGEGPFTVLAPTNAAFEDALTALGLTQDELLESEFLADILTYHVLPIEADSQAVSALDGEMVETVNGASISIAVSGGTITIDGTAEVVSADLEADNGIVHVINAVLLPPDVADALGVAAGDTTTTTEAGETTTTEAEETTTTEADETTTTEAEETTTTEAAGETIADIVAGNEDFSTLLAAVEAADLTEALADPEATLTVFAPTNEAFEALLVELDTTVEDLLASPDLADILLYHVLGQVVTSGDIAEAGTEEITVETLEGSDLVIVVGDDGSVGFSETDAMVTEVDIEASNGVIHVIDGVLLPPSSGV